MISSFKTSQNMSSSRRSSSSSYELDGTDGDDNTTQLFKTKTQASRHKKSKRYAKDAALEMAVAEIQAKMPGPITAAITG